MWCRREQYTWWMDAAEILRYPYTLVCCSQNNMRKSPQVIAIVVIIFFWYAQLCRNKWQFKPTFKLRPRKLNDQNVFKKLVDKNCKFMPEGGILEKHKIFWKASIHRTCSSHKYYNVNNLPASLASISCNIKPEKIKINFFYYLLLVLSVTPFKNQNRSID